MVDSPPASAASLQSSIRLLRRRLWLIALCCVLVPASVVAYSLAQEKQYRAPASLLFQDPGLAELLDVTPVRPASSGDDRTAATNVTLAGLDVVAARTASRLGVPTGDVASRVDVAAQPSSNVTQINATDASPVVAARLANTYADEVIDLRREAAVGDVRRAQAAVEKRLAAVRRRLAVLQREQRATGSLSGNRAAERRALADERAKLLDRSGELQSLASLVTGNVELVQRAQAPSTPSSPQTRRDAVIGLGLGLVLGVVLALLFEMLDRRLRDPFEVTELVDPPVLGAIPHSRALAEPPGSAGLPDAERQAFHMLRTSLRHYNGDREVGSVLITSAGSRDGKTTVAWNLAVVSAQAGERVLVLEADLRRPSLAARCSVPGDRGLADVLRGDAGLADVASEVVVGLHVNGSTTPVSLDVVVAGAVAGDITALIESPRMDSLLREARELYDLVVVDTPPISVVPDAMPLVSSVSGVVIVTRMNRTTRDAVAFLNAQLGHIRAPVLGVVVNGIAPQDRYYSVAYGYARPRTSQPESVAR